jgi:3'-5' exoribonuclease
VATIAELSEDRTVDGVFAVARKRRLTTRKGKPYLALELVDPSGRIEGRVWEDVELLDRRFAEGDAVRVLGRVERFDGRLQLQVRALEATEDDPAALAPALRRDADELEGFLEFLAGEVSHPGLAATVGTILGAAEVRDGMRALPAAGADGHHGYAGGLLEHTVGVATLCRETAQLHPRLRADLLLAAALLHDVGRVRELRGQELEEAFQLVGVAPQGGGEPGRIGVRRRLDRPHVELQPVAEALDAAEHAHRVAFAEASVEQLDVVPDPRVDAAGRIDELER